MSEPSVQDDAQKGTYVPIGPDPLVLLVITLGILTLFTVGSVDVSRSVVNRAWSLALSSGGRYLTRETDQGAALFDVRSGQRIETFRRGEFSAFSPDGKILAVAGYQHLELWDLSAGTLRTLPGGHALKSVAFSKGGTLMVTCGRDGAAILRDVASGGVLKRFEASDQELGYAALSPDGSVLATGGVGEGPGAPANPGPGDDAPRNGKDPPAGHLITLWDVETGEVVRVIKGPEYTFVRGLSFSPDGRKLAVTGPNRVWDVETGKPLYEIDGSSGLAYNSPAFFSPDGSFVVYFNVYAERGTSVVRLYDAETGEVKHSIRIGPGFIWAAAFGKDPGEVVTANGDGEVMRWSLKEGRVLETRSGFTWQPIPIQWMLLGTCFLVWAFFWAWIRPRRPRDPEGEALRRRRATWAFTTIVAGVVLATAILLHGFMLLGFGELGTPCGLALLQVLVVFVLLGVWAKVRPAIWAGVVGVLCVLGLAGRTALIWVEIVSSI